MRLRHQLGLRTKFGRDRLGALMEQVVRQLENLEEAGEPIELNRLGPSQEAEILVAEEEARRENEKLFLDTLDLDEVACLLPSQRARSSQAGRGAAGSGNGCRSESEPSSTPIATRGAWTVPYSCGIWRSGSSRPLSASTRDGSTSVARTHQRRNVQTRDSRLRTVLLARAWPTQHSTADSVTKLGGHAGRREERRQLGFVLTTRVRLVVAQAELTDQRPASTARLVLLYLDPLKGEMQP
ncbi:MAG: hypothetical protein ACP5P1_08990 [Acidimicrobiales bacterium]